MLVTGDREVSDQTVAVRSRAEGDLGSRAVAGFVSDALAEIGRRGA
jgi:threonyl-tRNA synthetase